MPDCDCSLANDRQRIIDNASWLAGRDVRLITLSGLISGEPGALYPQICAIVIPADTNPHMLDRDFSSEVLFSASFTDTRRDPIQRIGMKEKDMIDEAVNLLRRDIEKEIGRVIGCDQHGMFYISRPNLRPELSKVRKTSATVYKPANAPEEDPRLARIFDAFAEEDKELSKAHPRAQGRFTELTDDDDGDSDIFERANIAASQALRDDLRAVAQEVGAEERQRTAEAERKKLRETSRSRTKTKRAIGTAGLDTTKRRKVKKI